MIESPEKGRGETVRGGRREEGRMKAKEGGERKGK
jgi:hypothetical protein